MPPASAGPSHKTALLSGQPTPTQNVMQVLDGVLPSDARPKQEYDLLVSAGQKQKPLDVLSDSRTTRTTGRPSKRSFLACGARQRSEKRPMGGRWEGVGVIVSFIAVFLLLTSRALPIPLQL